MSAMSSFGIPTGAETSAFRQPSKRRAYGLFAGALDVVLVGPLWRELELVLVGNSKKAGKVGCSRQDVTRIGTDVAHGLGCTFGELSTWQFKLSGSSSSSETSSDHIAYMCRKRTKLDGGRMSLYGMDENERSADSRLGPGGGGSE